MAVDAETKEYIVEGSDTHVHRLYTLIAAHDYCVAGRFKYSADMHD